MKTIAIHLRLETASHRKRMMGIFRFVGAKNDWDIRIIPNEDTLRDLLSANAAGERPDGIISGVPYSKETKTVLCASGIPFVGIGMSETEIAVRPAKSGFVLNDNDGIGKAAADYFLSLGGFRSYAYVPDLKRRTWSNLRGQAFAEKLAAVGKTCRFYPAENRDAAALVYFVRSLPKPAAILAAWDGRGADVLHAAHKAGLRIPEDLSVLGVDDDDLICEHTIPTLSSVRTDSEGMGEAAARLLNALLSGKPKHQSTDIRCPILGLTERGSTRPPAPATDLIERALSFIRAEAQNGITAEDVARNLKISRRLMDLRFKQYSPKSVAELITEQKIERARRLLSDAGLSVQGALAQAGFGNIAYATRVFRESTGCTPESWRKQQQPAVTPVKKSGTNDLVFERLTDLSSADARTLKALSRILTPDADFRLPDIVRSLRCGTTGICVLRKGKRIVASATTARFSTPTGGHCHIEDVVVDEKHRSKGLGRRIMTETLSALRQDGVASVELTSRPSRLTANALYKSLGFKRRQTNVYELTLP